MKILKKKDAINPKGKVLVVFEDEWHGQFAVTKDKNRFYLGKSDANWMYKDLRVRDDVFQAPWAMSSEEAKEIRKALVKDGVISK